MNASKMPMALLPPPTHATIASGSRPTSFEHLRARFAADHRLEFANHQRIRMRAEHRSEQVVRVADVGHPIAHRLVDRVLQRAASAVDAQHFRAEQPHAEHVQRLPLHVLGAHVDVALEAEQRAGRRGRDAVLARAGFGDDAALAHPDGEQRLPERVVDLVRAGMREIFALQEDPRAAGRRREPRRFVDRRRPPDVVLEQPVELAMELRILPRRKIRALELLDRLDQRFGHEAAAELAEVSARVGIAPRCRVCVHSVDTRDSVNRLEERRNPSLDP